MSLFRLKSFEPCSHDSLVDGQEVVARPNWLHRAVEWREQRVARKALRIADEPNLVLDFPCDHGRFWTTLTSYPNRLVLATDDPSALVDRQLTMKNVEISDLISWIPPHVFSINLNPNSVDTVFCMHLLNRLIDERQRAAVLRELHRVTRDTVIVSLWVDGNYEAYHRSCLEKTRAEGTTSVGGFGGVVITRDRAEEEFHNAGFDIVFHLDLLPLLSMQRTYVLRKVS